MTSSLQKLADTIGILTSYTDACNQEHEIEDNVIRLLAEKLGYKAGNEEEIARSIELYHKKRWQKTLESISVVEQKDIWFDVVLPENHDTSDLKLRLRYRGNEGSFEPGFGVFDEGGRYTIGHTVYKKVVVKINGRLEVGYYGSRKMLCQRNARERAPVGFCCTAVFSEQQPQLGNRGLYRPV